MRVQTPRRSKQEATLTIPHIHKPGTTGNAVFKFAEEIAATNRAGAPIARGWRADIRVKSSLQCACGRALQPYDVEADEQLVRLVCTRCHTELLVVELSAGAPS
jgi:hypothetical protein